MSVILPYGSGPGQWDTIQELLQSAANYDFANGQKMTIKGTVCGNVANASSVQGNGNYSNTGTVGGIEWVGPTGPIHSTYTSQPFACQWFTVLPPSCPSPPNEPSDQLFVDIATASNTAKALTPTQTYAGIDTNSGNVTINVVSGLNVINVPPNPYGTTEGKLQVRGNGDLIISGPADAVVIFNVGADNEVNAVRNGMDILNGRSVLTTGGVEAKNILFNVLGGDVTVNAGVVNGSILVRAGSDVKGKATIQGTSLINGIVIGDGNHSSEFLLDTNATICGPFTTTSSINVIKEVSPDNGVTWFDANTAPGPFVVPPNNPQFRFTVTNTGTDTLTNVQVTDDVFGLIGTLPSLAPGASFQWIVNGVWAAGQNVNTATATGTDSQGQQVTDTDPAYYFGSTSAINVLKEVSPDNGATWFDANDPTGPIIPQGITPQFRWTVTNIGLVPLTNVVVTDNVYGAVGGPINLAPGASQQWIFPEPWAQGQQTDIATATGTDPNGQTITDTDPANYFGAVPEITILKEVSPDNGVSWFDANSPTGPVINPGTNPQFRFTVTNSGLVPLTNVNVTDNVYGNIGSLPNLAPAETFQWIITVPWAAGQQTDTATATGTDPTGQTVTATDPANYIGTTASIDVEKEVSPDNGVTWFDADTPTGPIIPQGTNPQFRFTVTNTGLVTLTNIVVVDDVYGLIGTLPSLAPGASFQWFINGVWAAGQQVNVVTASGEYDEQIFTDTDPAYYLGAVPSILVLKEVSPDNGVTWLDANNPPGPNIPLGTNPQFRFTVTNNGNVTLNNVQVTDNVYGNIGSLPSLAAGASFQWIIIEPWAPGQQTDIATATGTDPTGQTVTDTDPANYFGTSPLINIIKEVSPDNGVTWFDANNPPGPQILQGTNPRFRYTVTNTGNATLTNVQITDNVIGNIGSIASLTPGSSFQVLDSGIWAEGQQTNIATVTGIDPAGQTLTDTDPANYFGVIVPAPAIRVIKQVSPDNGVTFFDADVPPGPTIAQGTNPVFRYIVTNIGNVTLTNVTLSDDKLGSLTAFLPTTTLNPGESATVTVGGAIWAAGQQTNVATATGQYQGQTVTDSNPANYFGEAITPAPAIRVIKQVSADGINFVDADVPPGPSIAQGTNPIFRYIVTNIGNVTLTNVTLSDDKLGPITPLPTTTLAPGQFFTIDRVGIWAQGLQTNLATATGQFGTQIVTGTNPANYTGTVVPAPAITVKKLVSPDGGQTFVDAETAPGPVIPQGTNPIFRFIVTNTGNVTLTNITLTDTVFGTITVPSTTLNPGQSFTIDRTGVWSPCEHMNVATVTGRFGTTTVTDSDQAHYVGLPNPTMFKQFSIEENVSIPNQKPTAEDILDANVSVVITDVHAIKTPKGTSYEGQIMTGWKLIVEGRLVQNVVYIADNHSQSVHAAEFEIPFSTFIILPENYKPCQPLQVEGFVEDVFVKLIDGRRIFKNVTLRIEAKSKC